MANPSYVKKQLEGHPLVRLATAIGAVVAGVLGGLELMKIFNEAKS